MPVVLSASLPALGWPNSLHSGVRPWSAAARCAAEAWLRGVAAFCVEELIAPECWSAAVPVTAVVLEVVCAKDGAAASRAATVMAMRVLFMCFPPWIEKLWHLAARGVAGPPGRVAGLRASGPSCRLTGATNASYSKRQSR